VETAFAARYGDLTRWHWWFRGRDRLLERVVRAEFAGPGAPSPFPPVVSLGCGPPVGLAGVARFLPAGTPIVGIDADPSGALRRASARKALDVPEGVVFAIGQVEASPLRPRCSRLAFALDVLEHLDDDAACLREGARLLAPEGLLVVTVPALPSLWGRQDVASHHRRRYTARSLREAFRRAGLDRPRLSHYNTLLFPVIAPTRWARRLLGLGLGPGQSVTDFEMNRPGLLNDALASVLAFERHLLFRVPLPLGVSLIATWRAPAS
jgi:SAM-dependent methyltransferase